MEFVSLHQRLDENVSFLVTMVVDAHANRLKQQMDEANDKLKESILAISHRSIITTILQVCCYSINCFTLGSKSF